MHCLKDYSAHKQMAHCSRVPVWTLLLSPSPDLHPLQHLERCLWRHSHNRRFGIQHLNVPLYMFSPQIPLPLSSYFWLCFAPLTISSWNDCPSWQDVNTSDGASLTPHKASRSRYSSVLACNSPFFLVLKTLNPCVILLYLSTCIFIFPPFILKSLKRKKRNAQVTTKYIFLKKLYTRLLPRWTASLLSTFIYLLLNTPKQLSYFKHSLFQAI